MSQASRLSRDRDITRAIHKLFWQANLANPYWILLSYAARIPAFVLYQVIIPIQIAYGIQAIITQHFEQVSSYAWHILALAIAYAVLWAIGDIAVSINCAAGSSFLQKTVVDNYLKKDYEFYSNTFFGSLGSQATRLRDAYIEYGQLVTLSVTKQTVIVVAGVAVIGYHSLLLAVITLLAMAAVLVFTLLTSVWRLKYRRILSKASSELAGAIGDSLSHGATVKVFAAEKYEGELLEEPIGRWRAAQYKTWITSVPATTGRMLLAAAATCLLLVLTARLYQQHTISIAIVALVQLYVIKMITATQDIAEMIKTYESIMSTAYHSVHTMLIEPKLTDKPTTKRLPHRQHPTITFEHVQYAYENVSAVSDFNLSIAPGEKVGLVGYSGSGKTTLTKLLLRFMDVDAGAVLVNGIDIRNLAQAELRRYIAYVPQEPLLFHRSIADNISYGKPGASQAALHSVARQAFVDEFVSDLPKGYATQVGERGVKLSGGQRQRVAIARAILKDAPVLVLDEATSALDSRSEQLIQTALWRLMKDRTALVIAHRLSTIQRMEIALP